MGPAILARAGPRFAAKIHGSALEYTVKPQPEALPPLRPRGHGRGIRGAGRLRAHGREPLGRPSTIRACRRRRASARPASTPTLFAPHSPRGAASRRAGGRCAADAARRLRAATRPGIATPSRPPRRSSEFAAAEGPRVVFVGKLIVSKGVDLLLAAWPLVHAANPGARLLMVGFGEYDDGAAGGSGRRSAAGDLDDRPRDRPARAGARGRGGGAAARCSRPSSTDLPPGYVEAAAAAAGSVAFAGRLEHEEVGRAGARRATRWSFPAPSPRRSGWSPPRPPRPARCRCRAAHSGAGRGEPGARRRAAARGGRAGLVPARRAARSRRSPTASTRWLAPRRRRLASGRVASARARRPVAPVELGGRGARRARGLGRRARRPAAVPAD